MVKTADPTQAGWLIWRFMFWSADGKECVCCSLKQGELGRVPAQYGQGKKASGTLLPENHKVSIGGKKTGRMYKTKIPISIYVSSC